MANPNTYPSDGRLTTLQNFTGTIGGTELMEIVSPGNASLGINYNITTQQLAAGILSVLPSQRTGEVLATNNGTPSFTGAPVLATSITAPLAILGTAGFGTETNPQYPVVISSNVKTGYAAFDAGTGLGVLGKDGVNNLIEIDSYSAANSLIQRRAQGTAGGASNLTAGMIVGSVQFRGYINGAFAPVSNIRAVYTDGGTTNGTQLQLLASAANAAPGSVAQAMMLQAGVVVGTATNDPGSGRILLQPTIYSSLTPPSSALVGMMGVITDANVGTAGSVVSSGGGTTTVLIAAGTTEWKVVLQLQ